MIRNWEKLGGSWRGGVGLFGFTFFQLIIEKIKIKKELITKKEKKNETETSGRKD